MSTSEKHAVIVGGGAIGVCAACFLAERGMRVTLIERGEIAGAATFGNAGLVSIGHLPLPRPGLVLRSLRWMFDRTSPLYIAPRLDLALLSWLAHFARACSNRQLSRSMELIAAISRGTNDLFENLTSGREDVEYHAGGYMDVYRTQKGYDAARRESEYIRSFGFPESELTPAEVHTREPALKDGIVGAIRHELSAFADPSSVIRAVARRARDAGAVIHTETEVTDIEMEHGAFRAVTTRDDQRIEGDILILAAGVWSTGLGRSIGVHVPMQPAKGYHVNIRQPETPLREACMLGDSFVIGTPMNGCIRFAGTLELTGLNHELRRERVDMLLSQASEYLRGVEDAPVLSRWCGLRPCTADGLPAVGWAPGLENVYVATGHAMMGFWTAPMTGKLIAEHIIDDAPSIDISPMRIERFRR